MATTPGNVIEQLKAVWGRLTIGQRLGLATCVVLVFGGVIAAALWGSQPDWRRLASDVAAKDASRIMARLDDDGIPYKLLEDGSSILVEADDLERARASLLKGGLVTDSDEDDGTGGGLLGPTLNRREMAFVHARRLEKQLARRLERFEFVEAATVTITPATDRYFKKGQRDAKATVVVKPVGQLSSQQIESIAHAVAGGVDRLNADNVAISDTQGVVLRQPSPDGLPGVRAPNLAHQLEVERRKETQVQTMLDMVYGPRKVVVSVSTDMDWDRAQIEEVKYDPEGAVVVEREIDDSQKTAPTRVPGGPVGATAAANGTTSGTSSSGGSRQKTTREVRKVDMARTERVKLGGTIKRLSVGVLVAKDLEAQIDDIRDTVSAAVGIDKSRGDTIEVHAADFVEVDDSAIEDSGFATTAVSFMPWIEYGIYGLLGLGFLFFTIRTIKRTQASLHAVLEKSLEEEPEPEPPPKSPEEKLLETVERDADLAGRSLKRWLYETAAN